MQHWYAPSYPSGKSQHTAHTYTLSLSDILGRNFTQTVWFSISKIISSLQKSILFYFTMKQVWLLIIHVIHNFIEAFQSTMSWSQTAASKLAQNHKTSLGTEETSSFRLAPLHLCRVLFWRHCLRTRIGHIVWVRYCHNNTMCTNYPKFQG